MEKVEVMYAFVVEDKGDEGIMGFKVSDGWMPMVGADMDRVKSLMPIAREISKVTGLPFKVLKFSTRVDITDRF